MAMARNARMPFHLDWFNVTYKSVFVGVSLLVLLLGAAGAYWYYFFIYTPKNNAAYAIERADSRLAEAKSASTADATYQEVLDSAGVALDEARAAFSAIRYDEARVAAINSENLSLKALRLAGHKDEGTRLVRFFRIEGDVRVKRTGEFSWEQANNKMSLQLGDQVKTSSSASAQLIYFDGTVTTIQPGSLLEIRDLYQDPVTKVRRVREQLNWGEVKASTQRRNVEGSYHEVATKKVAARSEEGGEFRVAYDEKKKTAQFDVFQGQIEVSSPGRRESLVAGEAIRASSDGRLSAKQALPGVPRLIGPPDQRVFIFEQPGDEKVNLSWEAISGATSYQLVISDKALFSDALYDSERDGTTAVLEGVPEGAYHWRVAAISKSGARGQFSSPRRFRVSSHKIRDRSDTEPPPLDISEFVPVGMMVIVNGKTEPGATLWADEEKIEVDDSGAFYAVIRLRREGMNRLRFVAQDTAGNETRLERQAFVEVY